MSYIRNNEVLNQIFIQEITKLPYSLACFYLRNSMVWSILQSKYQDLVESLLFPQDSCKNSLQVVVDGDIL
jgi:hypothetical protein